MRKIFHLSSCSTCVRILNEWAIPVDVVQQNIKEKLYSEAELDEMKELAGSYEAIFSKRSMKYKEWNVATHIKSDVDYRAFLLKDYTFLKRPVLVYDQHIFCGNAKQEVEQAGQFLLQVMKK